MSMVVMVAMIGRSNLSIKGLPYHSPFSRQMLKDVTDPMKVFEHLAWVTFLLCVSLGAVIPPCLSLKHFPDSSSQGLKQTPSLTPPLP